jgi:RNA polymerase sigma-70 factor (ECF subfamily)
MAALAAMLAADGGLHADGGGKRPAARRPILGFDAVMNVHRALAELFRRHGSELAGFSFISGLPGFVSRESDGEL